MKIDAAVQSHIGAGRAFERRWMLWVEAKNRTTGAISPIGVWGGSDDESHAPTGAARLYHGGVGVVSPDQLVYGVGTDIRSMTITLSSGAAEVEEMVRAREVRFCNADVFCAFFDAENMQLLGYGQFWRGQVEGAPINTPELGGAGTVTLELATRMRAGTKRPASKKSDQAQRKRLTAGGNADLLRQYAGAGLVHDWWGARRG